VCTDREGVANRPNVIIKNKKEKTCIPIDVAIPVDRSVVQKEAEKETKIQEFMYKDTMNVEHEMYDYTTSNWSHQNSNERFKGKFRSHTRKIFSRFATKDSCTWNIACNMETLAV
jgi:hypothetical protein